jgi:uncharacterized protein (DUF2132 family)
LGSLLDTRAPIDCRQSPDPEINTMLSFLKRDPSKKLNKQYYLKLEQAMQAQRKGDIKLYSSLTAEAEAIKADIDRLDAEKVL